MASVNKWIGLGNLGRDPETRMTADGNAITNISVATTDSWKDKATGEKREQTEWTTVVFFGRLAEIAGEYLKKGSQVYIEGKLRTRKWTDKEGKDRYSTEVVADVMQMVGKKPEAESPLPAGFEAAHAQDKPKATAQDYRKAKGGAPRSVADLPDDGDIPF